jgi:hypothetical protein
MLGEHLAQPPSDPRDGRRAGLDEQLAVGVAADVEPEEVEPATCVRDRCLVLMEGESSGCQPLGQPCLDLFGLPLAVTGDDEVVGITHQNRGGRPRPPDVGGAGLVAHPGGVFEPVQRDVQ